MTRNQSDEDLKEGEKMTDKTNLERLQDIVDIQTCDGIWNHDPYMHGMANGLLLAQSVMDDSIEFTPLEAPEEWSSDNPISGVLSVDEETDPNGDPK